MSLIGNSLQGSELYCVIFMLCYANVFSQHEKNMERECWNQNLSEYTDQPSAIKTENISKDMPSYRHGKEQLYQS